MADNKSPIGDQLYLMGPGNIVEESFDLRALDVFSAGLGVEYTHYKAMPSPIGKKDRGDYRRSDGVDTVTSNGLIYKYAGKFSATMTDNAHNDKRGDSGILDFSEARLVMPRFYNNTGLADGERIYLLPGDRIYVADPTTDVRVSNAQEMTYEPGIENIPMFPIVCLELPITDSRNFEYVQGVDYCICSNGNISWMAGGNNPGIDPDTGKGRVYSIRYLYRAYWYIYALPKEVRVTNVTVDGIRKPERMSYHAIAVREYIYHNQNKGGEGNQLHPADPKRADKTPEQTITPNKYYIPVDMSTIKRVEEGNDGEQS